MITRVGGKSSPTGSVGFLSRFMQLYGPTGRQETGDELGVKENGHHSYDCHGTRKRQGCCPGFPRRQAILRKGTRELLHWHLGLSAGWAEISWGSWF